LPAPFVIASSSSMFMFLFYVSSLCEAHLLVTRAPWTMHDVLISEVMCIIGRERREVLCDNCNIS